MERAYGKAEISERHRHRYEFNNEFRQAFLDAGMVIGGTSPDGRLVEAVEVPGERFCLGVQFHPNSRAVPTGRIRCSRISSPPLWSSGRKRLTKEESS